MKKISNRKKRILIAFIFIIIIGGISGFTIRESYYFVPPLSKENIENIKESNTNKLMIVAHPDDETLWGGSHLLDGGYYVVCVTLGYDKERSKEFYHVIEKSGNQGIILNYPDKVWGVRDDWEHVRSKIEEDILNIINAKDWDIIVTHNKNGEYGHIHHKLTNIIVTRICENENITNKLYYFGKYYRNKKLQEMGERVNQIERISDEKLKGKEQLLSLYSSQNGTIEKLSHMNPYENWEKYIDQKEDVAK